MDVNLGIISFLCRAFNIIRFFSVLQSVRHVVWARVSGAGTRVLAAVRAARAERCATLAAPRALPVARQRPAWATLQDLYDSSMYCFMNFKDGVWFL